MTLYGEREGAVRPMPTVPVAGKRGRFKVQGTRHKEKGFRKQESGRNTGSRAIDSRGRADEMRRELLKIVVNF